MTTIPMMPVPPDYIAFYRSGRMAHARGTARCLNPFESIAARAAWDAGWNDNEADQIAADLDEYSYGGTD